MDFIEALETELGVTAEKNLLPMQPGDVRATWSDCTALERDTGYRPGTDVRDGVRHVPTGTCRQYGSLWGGTGSFTVFEPGGPGPDEGWEPVSRASST